MDTPFMDLPFATHEERDWLLYMLGRITYKPTWTFKLERPSGEIDPWGITIRMYVPNSRGSEQETTPVQSTRRIPWMIYEQRDEKHFVDWLSREILSMERHELDEWFKIDGIMHRDPHASDKAIIKDLDAARDALGRLL
jgi:hypothetical protein